jgi:alanine racemase
MPAADVAGRPPLPIHLEVETGLGRGGLNSADIPAAAAEIEAEPRACLAGLWSHLQNAGDFDRTVAQATRFGVASGLLDEVECSLPGRHLAASGGLLAASAPGYDVVRIGLALYGIVPDGLAVDERHRVAAAGLRPIMVLKAKPVRVAWLEAGTGVSYGPTFVTTRRTLVATIPIGYADGYPRSLSNRARVLVRGRRVPAIGTVAMDAVMVDVTDVPGPPVSVDDEFVLIGSQGSEAIDALEVARWGNTISYEIVTAMSSRLARVYYAAAEAVQQRTVACDLTRGGSRGDGQRTEAEE